MVNVFFRLAIVFFLSIILLKESNAYQGNETINTVTPNLTQFSIPQKRDFQKWYSVNKGRWLNHPEFNLLPHNTPCNNCIEQFDKRTEYERYFVDVNDTTHFYLQKGLDKLHIWKEGFLQTISHHIKPISDDIFSAPCQSEPVTINLKKGFTEIETQNGKITFNQWQLYGSSSGIRKLIAKADYSKYTSGDDGVYVSEIFPGIDVEIKLSLGRTETDFIVRSNKFPNFDTLLFQDVYESSLNIRLHHSENNEVSVNHNGLQQLNIAAPATYIMSDYTNSLEFLNYEILDSSVAIIVPGSWLNDKLKRGNVIIDPLVTSSATLAQGNYNASMYNASCSWTNACSYNLSITPPANATYTNIITTSSYRANSPCALKNGAWSVSLGSCSTGNLTCRNCQNFNPPCNPPDDGLPGECWMNNWSLWNTHSSCMPAPSCNPSPITFPLNMYRDCSGSAGCNGSCVGSGRDWNVTIEGRTLEFLNPTSPLTVSQSSLCEGGSITASTNSTFGVVPYTYTWSVSNGATLVSSNGNNANIDFPNPGSYSVAVTVTDNCNSTVTASRTITVNPLPNVTAAVTPSIVCYGDAVDFTSTGAVSYQWSNGGSGSPYSTTGTQSGTYTVTGTDANNCQSSATTSLTVNPLPIATISSTPSEICFGDTAILTAAGGITYSWSPAAFNSIISVHPITTTDYAVTVTDANSCTDTDIYSLVVNPLPDVQIEPDTTEICFGKSVFLTATNANTYTWNTGETSTLINPSPLSTFQYSVIGEDTKNCINYDTVVITVYPLPVPDIVQLNEQQCYGTYVEIKATAGVIYQWSSGDSTDVATVYPTASTTYIVTVTDIHNCSEDTSIFIFAKPPYQIDAITQNPPCYPADIGTIRLSVNGSNGAFTYNWNEGRQTSLIDSLKPGLYTVSIADALNCDTVLSYQLDYDYLLKVNVLPGDTSVPEGVFISFNSTVNVDDATTYSWTPNYSFITCKSCSNPTFRASDKEYIYDVLVVNRFGCRDSLTRIIKTFEIDKVFVPNTFSPNGDNSNDFYQIFGIGVNKDYMPVFELKVFNRIGEMVYFTEDPQFKWDGRYRGEKLSQGVYVYMMKYKLLGIDNPKFLKGSLTIID